MTAEELRKKFIAFFVKHGHKEIPSASLIPENDPTTLFTSSGMQPLVPYLLGEKHPLGKRLVNSQICFRAEDIEKAGDSSHTTFFEMLGSWSLGDYYKKEQLPWFFEFLTKVVGLNKNRLYVSVFDGDKDHKVFFNNKYQPLCPDVESIAIWKDIFRTKEYREERDGFDPKVKIYTYGPDKNWWSRSGTPENMPPGEIGGPDSEVFYDLGPELKLHDRSPFTNQPCHVYCECGRFLEVGNSVFIEYKKIKDGVLEKLPQKNVDFGGGLERILAAELNSSDVFKTELFWPIIQEIEDFSDKKYQGNEGPMRVIADHLKAATFMAQEGLEPSNKKQGYIMRRLIRRSVVKMMQLNIVPLKAVPNICQQIIDIYGDLYFDKKPYEIHPIIGTEVNDFLSKINKGTKLLQTQPISGKLLFDLHQSYGFPFEVAEELLNQWGRPISRKGREEFEKEKKRHQKLSRTASRGMFKGGLANQSEAVIKLHTATHLLHAALRKILGEDVQQVGSNITAERLRFDFTHQEKLSNEEIKKIEALVNQGIKANLPVVMKIMNLDEAKKEGALAFFGQRYPDKVKVYSIKGVSQEVCAGPHVDFTETLGKFIIDKEESAGAGKRRIYARLVL